MHIGGDGGGRKALYWSRGGGAPPALLYSQQDTTPAYALGRGYLDPRLELAIVERGVRSETLRPSGPTELLAVPLKAAKAPYVIWQSGDYARMLALMRVPALSNALVAFVAETPKGRAVGEDEQIVAVDCSSGTVTWRARIGSRPGMVWCLSWRRANEGLAAWNLVAGQTRIDAGELWRVYLQNGHADLLAAVPAEIWSVFSLNSARGGSSTFVGGGSDLWQVRVGGERAVNKKIIAGSATSRLIGLRASGGGGVDVFLATMHCIWQCRTSTGEVRAMWGTPSFGDEPPVVVGSPQW
jgi:hypothetical protein